jgi:hypothetical protein
MPRKELTQLQVSALITLWAQPDEWVPNNRLENVLRIRLERPKRDDLAARDLITVRQERKGGPVSMRLTEQGRDHIYQYAQLDTELPSGTKSGDAALRAVLVALRPIFNGAVTLPALVAGRRLASRVPEPDADRAPDSDLDMEARIRKAYAAVARPGAWVMLSRLREAIGAADRADVDGALVRLNRAPDVHIIPESNQKALTAVERAAAVSIGNQDRHAIQIGA